jgi:16S rRNA (cytidine1402-2'-O)-methyltransferase
VNKTGNLYLVPNIIADETQQQVIPLSVVESLKSIHHFFAEDIRTARRYLSSLKIYDRMEALEFNVLNKDTATVELSALFTPLLNGKHVGVLSESGCPGIADPGALAVEYAHTLGVKVIPLVGPSSIILALMASGLNGQHFAFHGYLPIDKTELVSAIRNYERESRAKNQTQLFIETPYRNNPVFKTLLKELRNDTLLCVALDLTGKNESIQTLPVSHWKKVAPEWPKLPAVFLFLAR